jgi:lipopolysaccharide/colanic/teichoic acid biosynthesis glycosyltransferase
MRGKLFLKRVLDFAVSFVGFVLLAIPFAIIAVAIKLDSKGSVFFRQERVGKDGRSFKVWKSRTMVVRTDRLSEG